jgi:hypothetical protein
MRAEDIQKLIRCFCVQGVWVPAGIYEERSNVIFDHFCHEPRNRSPRRRDEVHYLFAPSLAVERLLDGLDLTSDTAHPRQQLLFFSDGMCHLPIYRIPRYPI